MFQNNNISPFKFALCNIGRSIRCVVKQCNRVIKWVLSKIYRSFLTLKLSLFLCHFFLLRWLNVCYVATLHVDNTWSIFLFSSLSDKNILETNKLYNFVCNLWEIIFTNSPAKCLWQTESETLFGLKHKSSSLTRLNTWEKKEVNISKVLLFREPFFYNFL